MLRLIRVEMAKTGRRRIQLGWDGESRLIGQLGGRHCSEYKCEDEESVGQFLHWVRSNKLEVHHFRCIVERDFVDCLKSSSSFVLKKSVIRELSSINRRFFIFRCTNKDSHYDGTVPTMGPTETTQTRISLFVSVFFFARALYLSRITTKEMGAGISEFFSLSLMSTSYNKQLRPIFSPIG